MIPDGIEPLVGWRYWVLRDARPRWPDFELISGGDRPDRDEASVQLHLSSAHRPKIWAPGEAVKAVCLQYSLLTVHHNESPPAHTCSCGVYATLTLDELREATRINAGERFVVGTVSLWGKVVRAERGYRAQYAYPKELFVVPETLAEDQVDRVREDLADLYGVPVSTKPWDECAPATTPPDSALTFFITQVGASAAQAAQVFDAAMRKIAVIAQSAQSAGQGVANALRRHYGPTPREKAEARKPPWARMNEPSTNLKYVKQSRDAGSITPAKGPSVQRRRI